MVQGIRDGDKENWSVILEAVSLNSVCLAGAVFNGLSLDPTTMYYCFFLFLISVILYFIAVATIIRSSGDNDRNEDSVDGKADAVELPVVKTSETVKSAENLAVSAYER